MNEVHDDDFVENEMYECLDLDKPKSFFLYAGAGSGKTRSLVNLLTRVRENSIERLRLSGRRIAIITYTNAACDEITERLDFDPSFAISTIHSFAWELIKPFQSDIRNWLKTDLPKQITELQEAQRKGRSGSKASLDRPKQIAFKQARLDTLDTVKKFTYNPNGDNSTRDSLSHDEVIKIISDFISAHELMKSLLIQRFPILLIDESQDTKKDLIEALFSVQKKYPEKFCLGLFGDTMQRIYGHGKNDLQYSIPNEWLKPQKKINHRCPARIVKLINKLRSTVDGHEQEPKKITLGWVRLFIVNSNTTVDKTQIEAKIAAYMAQITKDEKWESLTYGPKTLILEHHMAAYREGFSNFFDPLYKVDRIRTGLLDGTLQGISFITEKVVPLVQAFREKDNFRIARIVRKYSPLFKREALRLKSDQTQQLLEVQNATNSLLELWKDEQTPTLKHILKEIDRIRLFDLPEIFIPIVQRINSQKKSFIEEDLHNADKDDLIDAWDLALDCSFEQYEKYMSYINDQSKFGTHQGVKGLEFPRVMVIIDDDEARGFLFSYDQLFGAKSASKTSKEEDSDTSFDRTLRLFYVTCSRAEESLAVVAYTKEPEKVRAHAINSGWFNSDEVSLFEELGDGA